ncbi:MAG: MFS transporter [Silicimonas sp.]|nr:MFS transporter [Silicimonas sp.]
MAQSDGSANLKLLFVMEVFSGLSRGSYLVSVGWTTLIVTNDVARVGQVFIVAMLTALILGPFVGTIVDRHSRRALVILAHGGIGLAMLFLGFVWLGQQAPGVAPLFAMIAAASALRMLHNSSHDGLIQTVTPPGQLMKIVARFRGVHLISTAVGTVLAGFVIEAGSPRMGFVFSACASFALILPMLFVRTAAPQQMTRGAMAFLSDLKGGVRIFVENRSIRLLALLAAVSLPVGQLSNAILSSFIRDDLHMGSDAFGIVDAAWPMGGMLAALMLSTGIARLSGRHMEYVFAALAGITTLAFSFCASVPALAVVHGAMGMTVWLGRIVIDGRILQTCEAANVGRTKAGVDMAFSLSAMVMCLSPTAVILSRTSDYFLYWGGFMTVVAVTLWVSDRATGNAAARP